MLLSRLAAGQPIFDATWGRPPSTTQPSNLKPILWAAYAVHSHGTEKTTAGMIRSFSAAVRTGQRGWKTWNGPIDIAPGTLACVDFEAELTNSWLTVADLAPLLAAYHDESPGLRVCTYMGMPGISSHENVLCISDRQWVADHPTEAAAIRANIAAGKREWKAVIDQLDIVCLDCYLLGEPWLDRDIATVRHLAPLFRAMYPGKKVFAWVTGSYTWPGQEGKIDRATLKRYADAIKAANFSGVVVWGPYENCDLLIEEFCR